MVSFPSSSSFLSPCFSGLQSPCLGLQSRRVLGREVEKGCAVWVNVYQPALWCYMDERAVSCSHTLTTVGRRTPRNMQGQKGCTGSGVNQQGPGRQALW